THAVIEASSHALDQGRCEGIRFSVGVFSNLTGDHLDYHNNMDAYKQSKKRLFDGLDCDAAAVVNIDDPVGEEMLADCCAGRVLRCSLTQDGSRFSSHTPDVFADIDECSAKGTRFDVIIRRSGADSDGADIESGRVDSPLIGEHNVQNSVLAAAAASALGIPPEVIAKGLALVHFIPGRLERVTPDNDPGFSVLVDYAHTDDALANVCSALRGLVDSRLIVMFGCGGDRDCSKRPRMARVAAKFADVLVVTSDNPRTEDPQRIIDDILAGFEPDQMSRVCVEPDRRRAIAQAIALAEPGDMVLLAGKGHETYQEIGRERVPFDDVAVANEILSFK
ncbi:MAG: UDP-N-acetylmuramoyl-L-alanyl-D-glutamate--2,6-diaminopimelate ligase, partial [Planctomycetota bacterium]